MALLPAGRKEPFPAFWLHCLHLVPDVVGQTCRENPLHYTPIATVGRAILWLAWHDGMGSRCVDWCLLGGRSGRLHMAVEGGGSGLHCQPGGWSIWSSWKLPTSELHVLGWFCPPALSPEQQAPCNLCPFSTLFAAEELPSGERRSVEVFLLLLFVGPGVGKTPNRGRCWQVDSPLATLPLSQRHLVIVFSLCSA